MLACWTTTTSQQDDDGLLIIPAASSREAHLSPLVKFLGLVLLNSPGAETVKLEVAEVAK
jgi:hypothetical protein